VEKGRMQDGKKMSCPELTCRKKAQVRISATEAGLSWNHIWKSPQITKLIKVLDIKAFMIIFAFQKFLSQSK
jgi:hypothetical protein